MPCLPCVPNSGLWTDSQIAGFLILSFTGGFATMFLLLFVTHLFGMKFFPEPESQTTDSSNTNMDGVTPEVRLPAKETILNKKILQKKFIEELRKCSENY